MKDFTQYIPHVFIMNTSIQTFITCISIALLLCSAHFKFNPHISNYIGNLGQEKSSVAAVEFHQDQVYRCGGVGDVRGPEPLFSGLSR
jgi:hypothetical protein